MVDCKEPILSKIQTINNLVSWKEPRTDRKSES